MPLAVASIASTAHLSAFKLNHSNNLQKQPPTHKYGAKNVPLFMEQWQGSPIAFIALPLWKCCTGLCPYTANQGAEYLHGEQTNFTTVSTECFICPLWSNTDNTTQKPSDDLRSSFARQRITSLMYPIKGIKYRLAVCLPTIWKVDMLLALHKITLKTMLNNGKNLPQLIETCTKK